MQWITVNWPNKKCFGLLGATERSCEHTGTSPLFKIDQFNLLDAYLHIQLLSSNIITEIESCLCPQNEFNSDIPSFLALFLVYTSSWGKYQALRLLYAPLFSPAELVVYSGL